MNEQIKEFFTNQGLSEDLVNKIQFSEDFESDKFLEHFNGFGKLPNSLEDLENERFTELNKELVNRQNSEFGRLRTRWENELNDKKVMEKTETKTPEKTEQNEVLDYIKSLKSEIDELKGVNTVKSLENQKSELLKKYNVSTEFHNFFKVSKDTDIQEFENEIKRFSETLSNHSNSIVENSTNKSFSPVSAPKVSAKAKANGQKYKVKKRVINKNL